MESAKAEFSSPTGELSFYHINTGVDVIIEEQFSSPTGELSFYPINLWNIYAMQ